MSKPPIKQKAIETPERLLELFIEYIADVKANPYKKQVFVGKDGNKEYQELNRPLTWVGFECYLYEQNIVSQLTHYEQNANESYTAYLPIIARIKLFIERDQFEGAVAGVYNANIIARKLGLGDKIDLSGRLKIGKDLADEQYTD